MSRSPLPLLALAAACTQAQAVATVPAAPVVRVAKVELGDPPPVRAVGLLAGKSEVRLSFKNGGTVERLSVEAGAHVRRGQVLASLNRTEIGSQVAQAEAAAEKARLDFGRIERLRGEGTVSQAAYDGAKTARDVAENAVTIARYNDQVAEIVAPEDGIIEQRLAEVSELIGPGQPVYTLRGVRPGLVVRAGLTDRDLLDVRLGAKARIRFGALPAETYAGAVAELATSANPRSGTFEAELRVNSADPRLLPGLVANVEIPRTAPEVRWVPIESLVDQSGLRASVFALAGDSPPGAGPRVQKRPVEIAYLDGARAAVTDGLDDVREVVTAGATNCAPGGAVTLVAPETLPAPRVPLEPH